MEFLSGFALALLMNILVIVGRDFGHLIVARVFMAFLLSVTAYLLIPFIPKEHLHLVLNFQAMVPALFWLVCQFAFNDRPRLKNAWSAMAIYTVLAPTIARYSLEGESSSVLLFFGWTLGEIFEYCLLLHGLWIIISKWSGDLVESRRKLRIAMLVVVGFSVVTAVLSLNLGLSGEYTRGIVVSISAFIISFFLIKGRAGVLFGESGQSTFPEAIVPVTTVPVAIKPETASDSQAKVLMNLDIALLSNELVEDERSSKHSEETQRLLEIMEAGFYQTENLTLKVLAKRIQLPEYKVRGLINQTLGYRNFNDYINQLRITDAAKRLIDAPDEPILNISLDVGYRSISSFNRAFKDILGVSPSMYREHKTIELKSL